MKLLLILLTSINAFGADANLQNIEADIKDGAFVGRLDFSGPINVEDVKVDFINETVQFDIPEARIPEGKKFTAIDRDPVRSLYTYQVADNTMRFRVIYNDGLKAEDLKGQVSMSVDGNSFLFKIKGHESAASRIDFSSLSGVIKSTERTQKSVSDEAIIAATQKGEIPTELPKKEALVENHDRKISKIGKIEAEPIAESSVAKKEVKAALGEADIPVLTKKAAKEKKVESPYVRMLASLGVVLAIIGGLIYAMRKWVKKNPIDKKATAIKVLSQHHLGPKKSLAIIQVAGESILVGMTDHSINHIKTLSLLDEEIPEVSQQSFDSKMSDMKMIEDDTDEQDEFAMTGIKDLVAGKLKGYKDI